MNVILRGRVVEIVDVRADSVHQRRVQRVHPLAASQNVRGGLAGIRSQSLDGTIYRRIDAAAQRASDVIYDGPASLVTNVLRDALDPVGDYVRGERLRFKHCFWSDNPSLTIVQ